MLDENYWRAVARRKNAEKQRRYRRRHGSYRRPADPRAAAVGRPSTWIVAVVDGRAVACRWWDVPDRGVVWLGLAMPEKTARRVADWLSTAY